MLAIVAPFFAAVLQSASFTCDKALLNIRSISYKTYTAVSFPLLVFFDGCIWLWFRPTITLSQFISPAGALALLSVGALIITNLLYYRALKDDRLSDLNVISLSAAIPVIVVNGFIFSDERHLALIIPALIAAIAVVWGHWEKHRMHFAQHTPLFLFWLFITAPLNAAAAKFILESWSPIMLELVRDTLISLVLLPLFYRSIRGIPARGWFLFLATNALSACAWVLYFYGYQTVGIVYTALLFCLQPLLTYFSAVLILGEPFVRRKFIAFLIVLGAIASAQLLR